MTRQPGERTLILLRHSKAEHVQGKPDHDRELAPRGRRDARAAGEWLDDALRSLVIDLALCSTSERTRQTLDEACGGGAQVKETRFDQRIYDAGTTDLLDVLLEVPDAVETVLVIGHAPGIPALAMTLMQDDSGSTDAAERLTQGFPTSGIAVLGFEGRWPALAPGTAYLREFVVPRG